MATLIFPGLLSYVIGVAFQLQQAQLFSWQEYAGLSLVSLSVMGFFAIKNVAFLEHRVWRWGGAGLTIGVMAFAMTGLRASLFEAQALDPALEGRDLVVTGVIASMPQHNDSGVRFRFDIDTARWLDTPVRLPSRLDLGWYVGVLGGGAGGISELQHQPAPVVAGERWQMTVRLKAPHGGHNPWGFDYELWLWEQGVQATGYVRAGPKDPQPQRWGQTAWYPVARARQQVREQIFQQVSQRHSAGLIAALVVGDQNAIDRTDWDVFRATGVAHLMSISGLHVTMFAWLAALLVGTLWRRSVRLCLWIPAPTAALVGGVALAAVYALFSGWGVPSQRTVWMLATVGLLRLSGKQWPWPFVWLLACVVVLVIDPWALLQAGFWLSFVAVGVLFATDSPVRTHSVTGIAAHFKSMMREQWVITLALTPLTLLLFGQVSLVGFVANALAIPWVTLVITPLAMLGVVFSPLWELAGWAISLLSLCLQWLAALPFASVTVAQAPVWAGASGVLGGVLLVMQLPWHLRLMGLPLVLPVLLWQAARPLKGEFELLAPDIGQGNAVIVRTAQHTLVYDAGPRFSRESDAGHRVLVPLLRALDTRVDRVVLSHRDTDHVGGALAVLTMQPGADLFSSIEQGHALQALRPVTRCMAGQRWRWDGVDFEVLHPRAADYDGVQKSNAMSCTLKISNGVATALLAGDIERAQEQRLVDDEGARLKSDVLLVPHHGSKTSSSAAFLAAVKPHVALVQAGYRNRYGHPAESVLVRYAEHSIRVVDSPHCGAATWQSIHPQSVLCERFNNMRYWHHRLQ